MIFKVHISLEVVEQMHLAHRNMSNKNSICIPKNQQQE